MNRTTNATRGALLIETLFTAFVWGVLLGSMHFVMIRYWNDRLVNLDRSRLFYDGLHP